MKKRWTMRRALLVLCIASVVFALLLQTFLFHQSLRRQIRAESISDHEISLNKMQTDLSNFIHTIRGEMLTIYSEQDLIAAMREAAEKDTDMKQNVRDFYEYNSGLMEPWDGPAAIAFTDGTQIGATLDRNGLRPGRYIITKDDFVIMASETGVIEVDPANIAQNGRITPGKMFLVDTKEGRIVSDEEIKDKLASAKPYGEWLKKNKKNNFAFIND